MHVMHFLKYHLLIKRVNENMANMNDELNKDFTLLWIISTYLVD